MARAALNWSLAELAAAVGVHRTRFLKYAGSEEAVQAIQRALEAAGVEFTNGDEPGVKLRKAKGRRK
jgi:hypothetical protein